MRAVRAAHPEAALAQRSGRIADRIAGLEQYRAARTIALFYPLPSEVDLRQLDARARAEGKTIFYPVMDPKADGYTTGLALATAFDQLRERGRSFYEPPVEAPRALRGEVELIVVPALAVSSAGHRLGYGAGFYDATLPDFCPPARTIVVAFDFQLLAELPTFPHDVACDTIVTDARTLEAVP